MCNCCKSLWWTGFTLNLAGESNRMFGQKLRCTKPVRNFCSSSRSSTAHALRQPMVCGIICHIEQILFWNAILSPCFLHWNWVPGLFFFVANIFEPEVVPELIRGLLFLMGDPWESRCGLFLRRIDDPLDASSVHGACGFWGGLCAVLFDWGLSRNHFHGSNGWTCKDCSRSRFVCRS